MKTAQQEPTEKAAPRTGIDQARAKVLVAEGALVSAEGRVGKLRSEAGAAVAAIEDLEREIPACADLGALRELSHKLTERRASLAELRTTLAAAENGIARPAAQRLALAREEERHLEQHVATVRASLTYEEGLVANTKKALADQERQTEILLNLGAPRIAALRKQLARLTGEADGGPQCPPRHA